MKWTDIVGQSKAAQSLEQFLTLDRVPHALLLSGPEGAGGLLLAWTLAERLLCLNQDELCTQRVRHITHPDLHFIYPTVRTEDSKKSLSKDALPQWRAFLNDNPYADGFEWVKSLNTENKQLRIGVYQADEVIDHLALKSYEGGNKVLILWQPEKMSTDAANKLLKSIEEPPVNTYFILVTHALELVLPTVVSRCQQVDFHRIDSQIMAQYLMAQYQLDAPKAHAIAIGADGSLHKAIQMTIHAEEQPFETFFVEWIRHAFMAKSKPQVLQHLVSWANELHGWGRERQKQFLNYALAVFRQALMTHYQQTTLSVEMITADGFKWNAFCQYVHGRNIEDILNEISQAIYHIERNAVAKMVLLDMSIKITRYLHRKI